MKKYEVVKQIFDHAIVAILRTETAQQAIDIAMACAEGGITLIELTFTVPKAHLVLETLADRFHGSKIVLGAGTVLDAETARIAILAGAKYIVSPILDIDMLKLTHRYGVLPIPGCQSVTEIATALEYGCDIVKYFPTSSGGAAFVRDVKAPLPQANIMPTGGVRPENIEEWLAAGACALGVGNQLVKPGLEGDFAEVTRRAKNLVERVESFRNNK